MISQILLILKSQRELVKPKQEYRLNVRNQLIMHLAAQNWGWHWQTSDRPVLLEDSKINKKRGKRIIAKQ
jgi:hypothetical protein